MWVSTNREAIELIERESSMQALGACGRIEEAAFSDSACFKPLKKVFVYK
jgi:hypothetical protein